VKNAKDKEQLAREVKERHADRLRSYANVSGVGVGRRQTGGRRTDEICVRVYVRRKLPEAQLRAEDVLPRKVDGVGVDVIEGEFTFMYGNAPPLPFDQRVARRFPFLTPGVSVGGLRVTAGTLGAAAYDIAGGGQLLLSNWHVLCGAPDCVKGEAIVQPGTFDGGSAPVDTMAALERFAHTDRVDAAVAAVNGERFLSDAIAGIGLLRGVGQATLGMHVRKSGRTTGVTSGVVDDISADVEVDGLLFRGQIVAVPDGDGKVIDGGDSGSLVVDDLNLAVGLAFAGALDGSSMIANQIQDVIDALQIRFTPEPSPLLIATLLSAD
jgi:hypothetical protein